MDKEKAKFILQSFRPDGADAADPDFAEALELAAADRELGEWLAHERAKDAAFAAALSGVAIPDNLRSAILNVLQSLDEVSIEETSFDAEFIGALASVTPPPGLRDQILNAMDVEQKVVRPSKTWGWRKISSMSAAAAAVVLGLFLTFGTGGNVVASDSLAEVHDSAISMLSAPLFSLDLKEQRQAKLYEWLQSEELPAPHELPRGLRELDGVGCKYLNIGEDPNAKGSLICFRKNDDTIVHLVIMRKENLAADVSTTLADAGESCAKKDGGEWAVTQWSDAEHAFFLLGKMEPTELAALF